MAPVSPTACGNKESQDTSAVKVQTQEQRQEQQPSKWITAVWLAVWVVAAAATGFSYTKCLLTHPKVLADQFVFENQTVLKMFIAAAGSSMLVQGIMSFTCPEAFEKSKVRSKRSYGYVRVIIGLSILGSGMAIAGSGPTMIPATLGARVESGPWMVLGGALGAFTAGTINELAKHFKLQIPTLQGKARRDPAYPDSFLEPTTINKLASNMLGKSVSYGCLAISVGLILLLAAIVLEVVVDYEHDNEKYGGPLSASYPNLFVNHPAWPPMIAGCMAGLSQLPVRMLSRAGLGGSTSYVTMVSTLTFDKVFPGSSLHTICEKGFSSWQFVHNFVFIVSGALLASFTGGTIDLDQTQQPLTDGFSPLRSMIGAFLFQLGGLIAGGCTCGHGITGVSEFSLESWVGAGAIFAAGIATRCIMVFACDIEY